MMKNSSHLNFQVLYVNNPILTIYSCKQQKHIIHIFVCLYIYYFRPVVLEPCYVVHTGLKILIFLSVPSEFWDGRQILSPYLSVSYIHYQLEIWKNVSRIIQK